VGPQVGPQTQGSWEKHNEPGRISADEAPAIRLRCGSACPAGIPRTQVLPGPVAAEYVVCSQTSCRNQGRCSRVG
jgi:hypothetical protein